MPTTVSMMIAAIVEAPSRTMVCSRCSSARWVSSSGEDEWKAELSREEYQVLRQAGTERAFVGEYTDTETTGVYRCKACSAKLFESGTKFHSGCGWPSFYQPITDTVEYIDDTSHGMRRTEVRCATCGSHLGHVFPDGYGTPTGDRFCINSISLTLEPVEQQ